MKSAGIEMWRRGWWMLILLVAVLVYFPALAGELLMDDAEHITPPALRSLRGLARIWFDIGATPHYYPVLNTAFWFEHRLWGSAPLGYHLANVFQHAGAACLVVALARRLRLPGAGLAGLLFAVHPVHVESVAWISEQKNTLSTLLALASALTYLDFRERRTASRYWIASGLFLLALFTKTVVAVVPPAILVIVWWQKGRLHFRRDVALLMPWLIAGTILGLFSAWFERVHSHAQGAAFEITLVERTVIAARAVCFYLRTLVWPADLMFINPRWPVNPIATSGYLSVAVVAALTASLVLLSRKWRGPLAAWLLFVGMLAPVLGFLNINWFNFSFVADHFQYLPSLGLIVPFAAVVHEGFRRIKHLHPPAAVIVQGALVVGLGAAAHNHARDFRNAEALYTATLANNPECWLAHNNLGTIRMADPRTLPDAIKHFKRAVELKPDHARAHANLGTALARTGRIAEAIQHQSRSIELQSGVAETHLNLGLTLRQAGAVEDAIARFDEALRLKPDHVEAHISRAEALSALPDKLPEAIAAYSAALAVAPNRPELHHGLALALSGFPEKRAESVAHYREALRLSPGFAEAYNNLATLLASDEATLEEAVQLLTKATEIAPNYADAHFNLGVLLASLPERRHEAIAQLQEAGRLRPGDTEILSLLKSLESHGRE